MNLIPTPSAPQRESLVCPIGACAQFGTGTFQAYVYTFTQIKGKSPIKGIASGNRAVSADFQLIDIAAI